MKNKRIFKTFSALCAALVLMASFSVTAFAQGTDQPPAMPSSLTGTWTAEPTMWALWSAQMAAGFTPWKAIPATPVRSKVIP